MRKSNTLLVVLSLAGIVVLLSLGAWQLKRLEWKEQRIAFHERALTADAVTLTDIEAGIENGFDVDLLRIMATGYYRHDLERHVYYLRKGKIGWRVVTPFVVPGRYVLLVDRGFVPDSLKDQNSRPASLQAASLTKALKSKPRVQWPEPIEIAGYVRVRAEKPGMFIPANEPAANRWYSYDLAAMSSTLPKDLGFVAPDQYSSMLAVFLQIEPGGEPGNAGIPVVDQLETKLKNDHLQYAITWFSLAAILAIISLVYFRSEQAAGKLE